jgi:hypothetical protein
MVPAKKISQKMGRRDSLKTFFQHIAEKTRL